MADDYITIEDIESAKRSLNAASVGSTKMYAQPIVTTGFKLMTVDDLDSSFTDEALLDFFGEWMVAEGYANKFLDTFEHYSFSYPDYPAPSNIIQRAFDWNKSIYGKRYWERINREWKVACHDYFERTLPTPPF